MIKKKAMVVCGWHNKGAHYFCKVSGKKLNFFNNIIGFEALKNFNIEKELSFFDEETRKKVELHNKAVWINDKGVEFHDLSKGSSSIFRDKQTGNWKESYKMETVDFVKFLEKFDKNEYELYVQMNIEGAEFDILDKMFESKIFEKTDIREFYLDNHTNIDGQEIELKKRVQENRQKLKKYFKNERGRPSSGNPEDFFYFN